MGAIMSKERRRVNEIYGHLYSNYGSMKDGCVYCGGVAEARDHVPCLAWIDSIDIEIYQEDYNLIKVPSCTNCNSILSDSYLLTINSRKKRILNKLKEDKNNRVPEWSKRELSEVSKELRTSIEASLKLKKMNQDRMIVLQVPIEDDPTEKNNRVDVVSFPKSEQKVSALWIEHPSKDEEAIIEYIAELYKLFEANIRWSELRSFGPTEKRARDNKQSHRYLDYLLTLRDRLENKWYGKR